MNRWVLKAVNVVLVLGVFAAIPYGLRAYKPIENNNKAVEALQNKQYDQAIALLSEAVHENPNNPVFKRNLVAACNSKAIDLERKGQDEASLDWYERALKMDPSNETILRNYISTLNNLAVAASKQKDFTHSQSFFERASKGLSKIPDAKIGDEIRSNYSALLTLWGAELMKRDQFQESQTAFEQSLELNPKNAVARIYLGDLFYERNDYTNAKKHYSAALPLDKENKEYLQNRLLMIGEESKVEGLFKQQKDTAGRFVVQYVDYPNGVTIPEVLQMLDEAYTEVGTVLGIYPARAVSVKIYNGKDFYAISKLPEWAIGIFDGKMRLKVEDVQSAPSQVKDLLYHEYTHAVLAMNVKQKVPAWFHEGLAQLMEPQFMENRREQAQMREALARKSLDFTVLQDSFKDLDSKKDAETAYLLSKYFLAHLNNKYGGEKLLHWIEHMAAEEKFDESFEKVYGQPLKKAQEDWVRAQLKK